MSFLDRLYYDEQSSTGLRWAVEVRAGKDGRILLHRAGDEAGSFDVEGYIRGKCGDVSWKAHRVVWELHNGPIPTGRNIDHINGVRSDNRIANLRLATASMNAQNTAKTVRNKSGVVGVTPTHQKSRLGVRYEYWSAHWVAGGKVKKKAFSLLKYGSEEAKRLATRYREAKIKELNQAGASYTTRHGT